METTPAIILILVSVSAIASIIAALKTVGCNGLKDRCAGLNSDNELLNECWQAEIEGHRKTIEWLEMEQKQVDDLKSENKHLNQLLDRSLKDFDASNENLEHAIKQAQKYHDLIAMPRRKRDALVKELRNENRANSSKRLA